MMEERDDLRKHDSASPWLSIMNDEFTKATSDHKRRQWREFVESIEHRTDSTKFGGRSKEFTVNPSRRQSMRASHSQEDPTPRPTV